MDVVGVAQVGMHSIKVIKLESILLKLDLVKSYDHVDWVFLRLILL